MIKLFFVHHDVYKTICFMCSEAARFRDTQRFSPKKAMHLPTISNEMPTNHTSTGIEIYRFRHPKYVRSLSCGCMTLRKHLAEEHGHGEPW